MSGITAVDVFTVSYANCKKIDYIGNFSSEEQANKSIDDILEENIYRPDNNNPIDRDFFVINKNVLDEFKDELDIYTLFVSDGALDYVNKIEVTGLLGIFSSLREAEDRLDDEPGNSNKPRHRGDFKRESDISNRDRDGIFVIKDDNKPKIVPCVDILLNPHNRNNKFGNNCYYRHFEIYKSRLHGGIDIIRAGFLSSNDVSIHDSKMLVITNAENAKEDIRLSRATGLRRLADDLTIAGLRKMNNPNIGSAPSVKDALYISQYFENAALYASSNSIAECRDMRLSRRQTPLARHVALQYVSPENMAIFESEYTRVYPLIQ